MDTGQFAQQMIAFQKLSIGNWESAMKFIQNVTEGIGERMQVLSDWLPKQTRETAKNWQMFGAQQLERHNAFIHKTFSAYETLFASPPARSPAKVKSIKRVEADTKTSTGGKNES